MRLNEAFIITRDGFKCIGASGALLAITLIFDLDFLSFLATILFVLTLWVYRNPERISSNAQKESVLSVVDGVVKSIETLSVDGEESYRILVKTSILDVSVLRVPFSCEVEESKILRGARLASSKALAAKINEQSHIIFGSGERWVKIDHTLHIASVGIKNRLSSKQTVTQGMRYGLMVKGETAIILPLKSRLAIKVGQRVRAGETLLGYFA